MRALRRSYRDDGAPSRSQRSWMMIELARTRWLRMLLLVGIDITYYSPLRPRGLLRSYFWVAWDGIERSLARYRTRGETIASLVIIGKSAFRRFAQIRCNCPTPAATTSAGVYQNLSILERSERSLICRYGTNVYTREQERSARLAHPFVYALLDANVGILTRIVVTWQHDWNASFSFMQIISAHIYIDWLILRRRYITGFDYNSPVSVERAGFIGGISSEEDEEKKEGDSIATVLSNLIAELLLHGAAIDSTWHRVHYLIRALISYRLRMYPEWAILRYRSIDRIMRETMTLSESTWPHKRENVHPQMDGLVSELVERIDADHSCTFGMARKFV
jgi:hypothetical protein